METDIPPVFNLDIGYEGGRVRKSGRKGILREGDVHIPLCVLVSGAFGIDVSRSSFPFPRNSPT